MFFQFQYLKKTYIKIIIRARKIHAPIQLSSLCLYTVWLSTFSTLAASLKSTNPKPLDRPVTGSVLIVQSTTSPKRDKYSVKSFLLVSQLRPPINILLQWKNTRWVWVTLSQSFIYIAKLYLHITAVLLHLHRLPICLEAQFKVLLVLTFKAIFGLGSIP